MNGTLLLKTKTGKTLKLKALYAFIIAWEFYDADSRVIIQSQNAHGPYQWELFDIASGYLVDHYYRSKKGSHPEWVKSFLDSED